MINAEQILEVLESNRFEKFYNGMFTDFISGEIAAPDREKVLGEITKIFRLQPPTKTDTIPT
jgi:hypothetical protein